MNRLRRRILNLEFEKYWILEGLQVVYKPTKIYNAAFCAQENRAESKIKTLSQRSEESEKNYLFQSSQSSLRMLRWEKEMDHKRVNVVVR